jgi:hypothetical protein
VGAVLVYCARSLVWAVLGGCFCLVFSSPNNHPPTAVPPCRRVPPGAPAVSGQGQQVTRGFQSSNIPDGLFFQAHRWSS